MVTSRIWFTPEQKSELWERWKRGQSISAISRALERRLWNAGAIVGTKRPLKPRDVWAIRFFLDEHRRLLDRALFDLAIDSRLRGCDIVKIKIGDVVTSGTIRNRATVIQQKTGRPVQFELMVDARNSLMAWLEQRRGSLDNFVFPSRVDCLGHLSTRQHARLLHFYSASAGARSAAIGCAVTWELNRYAIVGFPKRT